MGLKIVVIGCGWISMSMHGPAYARYAASHEGIELAACCDVDSARAEQFRQRYSFGRSYTDYLEMLEQEKPGAVCLNTPVGLISPLGCRILQAGYPLLAEKPPGLTVQEIDALIEAAAPRPDRLGGVIHMVAFNRRFTPLASRLKELLEGLEIQHLHYHMARFQRLDPDFSTTAIHAIDAARFLAGSDYRSIRFHYLPLPKLGPTVANFMLDCTFASGATAQLTICPAGGVNVERAAIHCAGDSFFLNFNNGPDAPGSLQRFHQGKLVEEINGEARSQSREEYLLNGFYAEDAAFFDAVQAGAQPWHDFRSCRQPVEVMSCLRERKSKLR